MAFRGLVRLWSGSDEAVGEVRLPAGLDRRGLLAHPALLDACFQVLGGVADLTGEGGVWLPIGWDRLLLRGALPDFVVCRALARGEGGETRKADLRLYAETGEELGVVEGFTLKRASRDGVARRPNGWLLHEVVWREGPPVGLRAANFLAGPQAIASGLDPVDVTTRGGESEPEGDRRAGAGSGPGGGPLRASRFPGTGVEPEARRPLRGGRAAPPTEGHGRPSPPVRPAAVHDAGDGSRGARRCRGLARGGSTRSHARSAAGSGRLRGAGVAEALRRVARRGAPRPRRPLDLLFGGEPGAANLYRDSGAARAFNRTVAEAVRSAVDGLPRGRSLRVLEVGAGTGGTTDGLLDALPAGRTRYDFTDISAAFFRTPSAASASGARSSGAGRWTSSGIRGNRASPPTATTS